MVFDPLLNLPATMNGSAIPEQNHRSPEMPEQMLKERLDIQACEIAGAKLKIERQPPSFGGQRQGADRRDPVLFVAIVNDRRFPFGGPGAGHVGDEQETGFIEEDQMGATSLGVFLYAASGTASNGRSPLRPVAGPGAPVSGNSTPCLEVPARHGWGGTECETASGSTERSVSRSTGRSDGRRPRGLPEDASSTAVSDSRITWADGPGSVWGEAPCVPSFCKPRTTERPSSWRRLRHEPPPTGVSRLSTTGWPVGAVAPVVAGSLGVS